MTEERIAQDDAGSTAFAALDPRLTIYALANGLDLDRGPGFRRLAWFRDGRERGILVEEGPDGTLAVRAMAWNRETPEGIAKTTRQAAVTPGRLLAELAAVLDDALNTANAL